MKTIEIIDSGQDKYTLKPDTNILGRRYDNLAETITIVKPAAEVDSACILVATYGGNVVDHIAVRGDTIDITSNLSQYESVNIGFSFSRPDGYVKGSEIKQFKFLPAPKPYGFVPMPSEQKATIDYLAQYGFVDAVLDNNILKFKNYNGDDVKEVQLSGFVQEQTDWNETNDKSETYIKNKPTKLSQFQNDMNFVDKDYVDQNAGTSYTQGEGINISEDNVISVDETIARKSDLTEVVDASTTQKGIIQIATDDDITAGTNETKAVTPKQLKNASSVGMVKSVNNKTPDTTTGNVELTSTDLGLGADLLNWKGDFAQMTAYKKDDVVLSEQILYVCLNDYLAFQTAPANDTTNWRPLTFVKQSDITDIENQIGDISTVLSSVVTVTEV